MLDLLEELRRSAGKAYKKRGKSSIMELLEKIMPAVSGGMGGLAGGALGPGSTPGLGRAMRMLGTSLMGGAGGMGSIMGGRPSDTDMEKFDEEQQARWMSANDLIKRPIQFMSDESWIPQYPQSDEEALGWNREMIGREMPGGISEILRRSSVSGPQSDLEMEQLINYLREKARREEAGLPDWNENSWR